MKLLLKILGGLAALVLVLALVGFLLPRQYRVERTRVIKASPDAVLAQVADLKAWKNWGAWQERDPGMKMSFSTPSTGVGAWSSWISEKEGSGKMVITAQTKDKVVYTLEFEGFDMKSTGMVELKPDAGGTKVVWSDAGDLGANPMHRWFGLFLDKMIGPDFERGLANMDKLVAGK